MKYLVETSGPFMLIDTSLKAEIQSDRPTVVYPSNFVMGAAARGQLKILKNDLPDEASDEDFMEFWLADRALAVDAYVSKFSDDAELDPLEPPKPPAAPKPPATPKPARKPRAKNKA